MNKQTALGQLKRTLQRGEILPQHKYVEEIGGKKCYCAVGHIMNDFGVDMEPFLLNHNLNVKAVRYDELDDYIKPILEAGFTVKQLTHMQVLNDSQNYEKLIGYIEGLMDA